jgi:hypothetical protein
MMNIGRKKMSYKLRVPRAGRTPSPYRSKKLGPSVKLGICDLLLRFIIPVVNKYSGAPGPGWGLDEGPEPPIRVTSVHLLTGSSCGCHCVVDIHRRLASVELQMTCVRLLLRLLLLLLLKMTSIVGRCFVFK